jgi:hypothetical protein
MDTRVGLYTPSGEPILIDDARSGLDCKCVCLDCGAPLIAVVNTTKKAKHFQHHNPTRNQNCLPSTSSNETALHLMLKKLISDTKRIVVPPIYIKKKSPYSGFKLKPYLAYKGGELIFDTVIEEKRVGRIIPDCIGLIGDRRLHIEIKVTHGVDDIKQAILENQNNTCVELYADRTPNKRPEDLLTNPKSFEWLHENRSTDPKAVAQGEAWFNHQIKEIEKRISEDKEREVALDNQERDNRIKKLYGKELRNSELMPNRERLKNNLLDMIYMGDANYSISSDEFYDRFNSDLLKSLKDKEDKSSSVNGQKSQHRQDHMKLWKAVYSSLHYYADFYGDVYPDLPDQNDNEAINGLIKLVNYATELSTQVKMSIIGKHFKAWSLKHNKYGQSEESLKKGFINTPVYHSAIIEYQSIMKCFPYDREISFPSNEEINKLVMLSKIVKNDIEEPKSPIENLSAKIDEIRAQLEEDTIKVIRDLGLAFNFPDDRAIILSRYYITPEYIRKELNEYYLEFGVDQEMIKEINLYKKSKSDLWRNLSKLTNNELKTALKINS